MSNSSLPGGALAARPLHFFWIVDCSGSMGQEGKIQELNFAIKEALPHMRSVADDNVNAEVLVRALKFSNGANWVVAQPVPVHQFDWKDLTAGGVTDLGHALKLLAEQLTPSNMPERGLPPVLVLLSDGQPTDDFESGLKSLMSQGWGKKAVRVAIAIGHDADHDVLQKFIGNTELRPIQANNPQALVDSIKWVSTAVLNAASSPASRRRGRRRMRTSTSRHHRPSQRRPAPSTSGKHSGCRSGRTRRANRSRRDVRLSDQPAPSPGARSGLTWSVTLTRTLPTSPTREPNRPLPVALRAECLAVGELLGVPSAGRHTSVLGCRTRTA